MTKLKNIKYKTFWNVWSMYLIPMLYIQILIKLIVLQNKLQSKQYFFNIFYVISSTYIILIQGTYV